MARVCRATNFVPGYGDEAETAKRLDNRWLKT
jgi:hypothetical protein